MTEILRYAQDDMDLAQDDMDLAQDDMDLAQDDKRSMTNAQGDGEVGCRMIGWLDNKKGEKL